VNSDPRPEAENGAAEPRPTPPPQTVEPGGAGARGSDSVATAGIRCVAALAPGGLVPDALARAMHKRGVPVVWRRGAYEAVLEVMRDPRGVALVVVEPGSFPNDQPARLARAAARHAPELVVWRYDAAETEGSTLRPYTPASRAAPATPDDGESPEIVVTRPAAFEPAAFSAGPRLRLAGLHESATSNAADDAELTVDPDEEPTAPSELLTADELTMLLGDGPPEESRGGSHG